MAQRVAGMIAAAGWFALLLQFVLQMRLGPALQQPPAEMTIRYFSYFTILTNILVALVSTAWAGALPGLAIFRRPAVRAGAATYIAVVGLIYSLLLRALWNPTGWQWLCDVLLHDIIPAAYLLHWAWSGPHGGIEWRHALLWLAWPLAYVLAVLARGAASGFYPYPFIDLDKLGAATVLSNSLGMLALFVGIGLGVVAVARLRRRAAG